MESYVKIQTLLSYYNLNKATTEIFGKVLQFGVIGQVLVY